jgi:hypothetical protein
MLDRHDVLAKVMGGITTTFRTIGNLVKFWNQGVNVQEPATHKLVYPLASTGWVIVKASELIGWS